MIEDLLFIKDERVRAALMKIYREIEELKRVQRQGKTAGCGETCHKKVAGTGITEGITKGITGHHQS
jgi:hypothetical protein